MVSVNENGRDRGPRRRRGTSDRRRQAAPNFENLESRELLAVSITNTDITGRVVQVRFSEAITPATLTPTSLYLVRAGGDNLFGNANDLNLTQDPRIQVAYNAAAQTA